MDQIEKVHNTRLFMTSPWLRPGGYFLCKKSHLTYCIKGGYKLSEWLNGLMLEALKELPGLDIDELVKMPKEVLMVELLSNTKKQSVVNGQEDWNNSDLYEIDLYGLRMDDFRDTLKEYEEGAKWVQPIKDYLATR